MIHLKSSIRILWLKQSLENVVNFPVTILDKTVKKTDPLSEINWFFVTFSVKFKSFLTVHVTGDSDKLCDDFMR